MAAIGQTLIVPHLLRSLSQYYEYLTRTGNKFNVDDKMIQFLVSGSFDVPDSHIRSFALDWWNDKKPRKFDMGRILNSNTIDKCLEFHNKEIKYAKAAADEGEGPPLPPVIIPKNGEMSKHLYGWHRNTWDDTLGNHCDHCRLYRSAALAIMDKLNDLRITVTGLQSVYQVERTLSQRDAVCLNYLYEEAVIMEGKTGTAHLLHIHGSG
jgi:hypothetical protein